MNEIIYESAYASTEITLLEESTFGGEQKIKFKAKLQEVNIINNNGRSYTDEVLRIIVSQLAPKASERKLLGEMDHPTPQGDDAAKMKRSSTIRIQDSCVLFTKIEYDGKFILAECETLTNDKGINLYKLLKDKVTIGFSLRAFGSSTKSPTGVVLVSPIGLKALTFDVVSNPSHSNAIIYEFLTESEDYLALAKELKSTNQLEVLLEESDNGYKAMTLDGECACGIDGICIAGIMEESIEYLIDLSINQSNKIKKFNFKLG